MQWRGRVLLGFPDMKSLFPSLVLGCGDPDLPRVPDQQDPAGRPQGCGGGASQRLMTRHYSHPRIIPAIGHLTPSLGSHLWQSLPERLAGCFHSMEREERNSCLNHLGAMRGRISTKVSTRFEEIT